MAFLILSATKREGERERGKKDRKEKREIETELERELIGVIDTKKY